ncbi:MAG: penicillin-insensitive murein endopeptidase [Hyphomicrobiaceae bacterium]|nr:penicillin-insensitive murein endopeptidase [Hyphomicrobiaceae bacterium]
MSRASRILIAAVVAGLPAVFPALAKTPAKDGQTPGASKRKSPPVPAKKLFKAVKVGAAMKPASIGYYTRGCLAGAEQLAANGSTWQAMRLSRNRHWGHPITISVIKRLSADAKKYDGWPGLLVGDISMPRGGPMPPSHASHQVGLDADIWLTPMPNRRLSRRERERLSATFMLTSDQLSVNREVWTSAHVRLIKRVASYREVERVLVHPAIKKELCAKAGKDRRWLGKVRPVRGHNYHFHIRLRCPPGQAGCRFQKPVIGNDGCGKELDRWYKWLHARLKPRPKRPQTKPRVRRKPRPPITLADMPAACRKVLAADGRLVVPKPHPALRPSAAKK